MRSSRKFILSVVLFLAIVAGVSTALLYPFLNSEASAYQDAGAREELAGEVDYIVCGASQAMNSFVPAILDEELGTCSYDVAGSMFTLYGRYYLLEKELARNPVDTVVLELSSDTFVRDETAELGWGDYFLLMKLDDFPERMHCLVTCVSPKVWANVYALDLTGALTFWKNYVRGGSLHNVDYAMKGYEAAVPEDMSIPASDVQAAYHSEKLDTDFRATNVAQFRELVELCRAHGTDIVVVTAPVPESTLWKYDGWDDFRSQVVTLCEEEGLTYYDFNLYKGRADFLDDATCYSNDRHLSREGAPGFTRTYCDVVSRADAGEDVASLFFESYEEAVAATSYAAL